MAVPEGQGSSRHPLLVLALVLSCFMAIPTFGGSIGLKPFETKRRSAKHDECDIRHRLVEGRHILCPYRTEMQRGVVRHGRTSMIQLVLMYSHTTLTLL